MRIEMEEIVFLDTRFLFQTPPVDKLQALSATKDRANVHERKENCNESGSHRVDTELVHYNRLNCANYCGTTSVALKNHLTMLY